MAESTGMVGTARLDRARAAASVELHRPRTDSDPKASCRDGLLRADTGGIRSGFVQGRPVSQAAKDFPVRACDRLAAEGGVALPLVRDGAGRRISRWIRAWIKAHNQRAKTHGGARIVACRLPVRSPRLQPIEPKWSHGKRTIMEPGRLAMAREITDRVCEYYGCGQLQPLEQTKGRLNLH